MADPKQLPAAFQPYQIAFSFDEIEGRVSGRKDGGLVCCCLLLVGCCVRGRPPNLERDEPIRFKFL